MASYARQPQEHDRTIKVTILASEWGSSKGGLSTLNRELAIQLAKSHDVKVTFFLPKCSLEGKEEAKYHGISIVEAERQPGFEELDWLSFPPQDLQIDIVVGHGVKLGKQAQVIRKSHKCKWIQVVHTDPEKLGMFKCYENPIPKGEIKHHVEVELCQMADLVVGVGPKLTKAFRKYLGWCKTHQDVLEFTPSVFTDFARVKQALNETKPRSVLVFGRGDDEDFKLKGFDIAARSVAAVPDTDLIFVGAQHGKEQEIAKLLLDSGIPQGRLVVRGFKDREALKQLFCEVDLMLMPSRTEGFGLTGLEALSARLPVIVSKNSGFGEALGSVPFGSSFVIDSEDPSVWTAAIKGIWNKDRQTRLDETKFLRDLYGKRYSWSEQCENLIEKMGSLLENRQGSSDKDQGIQRGMERKRKKCSDQDKEDESYDKPVNITREAGDLAREAMTYFNFGLTYDSQGDFPKAIECLEKSLKIASEAGDWATEGLAYLKLGLVYDSQSDFPKAIENYEKSIGIAKEAGDRATEGKACLNLGLLYDTQKDFPKAIEYYEKRLEIAWVEDDRATLGKAYLNLGLVYHSKSDFPKAIECFEEGLKFGRKAGDRATEGKAYLNLGLVYYTQSDNPKAIKCFESCLKIAREEGDQATEGQTYFNLGILYESQSNVPKAIDCYEESLKSAREAGDRATLGQAYFNAGANYFSQSDFPKAVKYFENFLEFGREAGDRATEGKAYFNLAYCYYSKSDFPNAIEHYEKSLKIAKEGGDRATEGRAYLGLGRVYHSQSDFREATKCYEKSLEIAKEAGDQAAVTRVNRFLQDSYLAQRNSLKDSKPVQTTSGVVEQLVSGIQLDTNGEGGSMSEIPLKIAVQPQSQTKKEGSRVELRCEATGNGLSYSWLQDGQEMEGQRGCCLVFEQVSMADFGSYVCQVEKKDQRCSSEVAELDVTPGDGKSEFTGYTLLSKLSLDVEEWVGKELSVELGGNKAWKFLADHYKMERTNINLLKKKMLPGVATIDHIKAVAPDLTVYNFCKTLKQHNIRRLDIVQRLKGHLSS
ncbi:uncharacterized protein LOC114949063 isoform X3 [Acropora millepora]|uniref:uncharacterized protein LOC114949063 isoform X3 n=1 Tax=Acropora millepora TaxID=45264 RepID=UPI001CF3DE05|nr:uncharacterized protein LOC114949063 isoform X3 [Acropora millepora]